MKSYVDCTNIKDLSYRGEFFSKLNSKFANWIVAIIGIFLLFFLGWLFFGNGEEVVSGEGIVRPAENISSVRAITSGKVSAVNFHDGQIVNAGDVLFTLYSETELANYESLGKIKKMLEQKINDTEILISSFTANKNIVPRKNTVAYNRAKMFFEIKEEMKERTGIYKKNYETQKALSKDLIAEDQLQESERIWQNAEIASTQFCEKFLSELINEKKDYELQRENVNANYVQAETLINNKTIEAPIAGTILANKKLNSNDFVEANEDILSIIPMSNKGYEILVTVRERDVANLQVGLKAKLKLSAYSTRFKHLSATVKKISPDSLSNGKDIVYLVTLVPDEKLNADFENEIKLKTGL